MRFLRAALAIGMLACSTPQPQVRASSLGACPVAAPPATAGCARRLILRPLSTDILQYYPTALRAAGVPGWAELDFAVDSTGAVVRTSPVLLRSSNRAFDEAAKAVARAWRFDRSLVPHHTPIAVRARVEFLPKDCRPSTSIPPEYRQPTTQEAPPLPIWAPFESTPTFRMTACVTPLIPRD